MKDLKESIYPVIEEDLELPINSKCFSTMINPNEELAMRARTLKLLSDLSGKAIIPSAHDQREAETLARKITEDPDYRVPLNKYRNETTAYLAGLVAKSNQPIVDELSELKIYVVNKLIHEVEHANTSKDRIMALSRLGEVSGVDAFMKRSEVNMKVKSMDEVEKELLNVLSTLQYNAIKEETDNNEPEKILLQQSEKI